MFRKPSKKKTVKILNIYVKREKKPIQFELPNDEYIKDFYNKLNDETTYYVLIADMYIIYKYDFIKAYITEEEVNE